MHSFTYEDIGTSIDALTAFIGEERIEKSIATWRNSISNSSLVEREYQRKSWFYWWPGFVGRSTSERTGTPYPAETMLLAKDALKVLDTLATMPASIRTKYAGALGDVRNCRPHLFEISMAHHFMSLGYQIEWMETTGTGIPEFIAKTSEIAFEVECKYVSVDAGRLVMRDAFARFAAMIEARFRKLGLMGVLKITFNKRLPKAWGELNAICDHLNEAIASGKRYGTIDVASWGIAKINVMPADYKVVDWDMLQASAHAATRNHSHAMAKAETVDGRPVNPIFVTVDTVEDDEYLRAINDTMMEASKRQLSKKLPGVLCIHIPEIDDFTGLAEDSALQELAFVFFDKERNNHVCAVAFSSDTQIIERPSEYHFSVNALAYRNAYCCFPNANKISIFGHDKTVKAQ